MNIFNKLRRLKSGETKTDGIVKSGYSGKDLGKIDSSEFEDFDKIVAKKGYAVYRDMLYDEQIKCCLIMKKFLILSSGYTIEPFDDSAEAAVQAKFVKDNFDNTATYFDNILLGTLSSLEYGFSLGEIIWKFDDWENSKRILLDNIKFKFPWDIDMDYDGYGNLIEVKIANEPVKMDKFILYSYMEQFGNKAGESDLKAVYDSYWLKKQITKFHARYLERFSSPIVKGHVPPGATDTETNRFYVLINRLTNIVGILLPRTKHGEEFDFELVETKRAGGNQFITAVDQCNTREAIGMLIPRLFGVSKENFGSYALGVEQFKIVYKFLSFIGSGLANDVINRQLIRRMIDYNFPVHLYPKLVFNPLDIALVKDAIEETRPDYPSDVKRDEDKDKEKIGKEKVDVDKKDEDKKEPLSYRGKAFHTCPLCNAKVDVSRDKKRFTCTNGHIWVKKLNQ